ncbi:hypothetical protein PENTCL1PPCAC_13229, partial [Pristionchus entomophagus]
ESRVLAEEEGDGSVEGGCHTRGEQEPRGGLDPVRVPFDRIVEGYRRRIVQDRLFILFAPRSSSLFLYASAEGEDGTITLILTHLEASLGRRTSVLGVGVTLQYIPSRSSLPILLLSRHWIDFHCTSQNGMGEDIQIVLLHFMASPLQILNSGREGRSDMSIDDLFDLRIDLGLEHPSQQVQTLVSGVGEVELGLSDSVPEHVCLGRRALALHRREEGVQHLQPAVHLVAVAIARDEVEHPEVWVTEGYRR